MQERMLANEGEREEIQKQLSRFLQEQVAAHSIEERDMLILSLRLGLMSEKCLTLVETGRVLHLSPECIRRRQHFLLQKKIKSALFFQLLRTYSLQRTLPHGFEVTRSGSAK